MTPLNLEQTRHTCTVDVDGNLGRLHAVSKRTRARAFSTLCFRQFDLKKNETESAD